MLAQQQLLEPALEQHLGGARGAGQGKLDLRELGAQPGRGHFNFQTHTSNFIVFINSTNYKLPLYCITLIELIKSSSELSTS